MTRDPDTIGLVFEIVFLALQGFVVLFLLFHDWIPLGRLNNLGAIQSEDSLGRRVFVTLLPAVPAAIGLYSCAVRFGRAYPDWLEWLLWITYGVFLAGMLRAWWIPYLFVPDEKRAERYRILFRGTHRFLPERNGIAPDTLHCSLHLVTLATVVALLLRDRILNLT
jgi:hypothetical protein